MRACIRLFFGLIPAVAGAQTIAITGGTVFPVSGPRIERGTVVIRDGKILAVGANIAIPANADRVDATGKWVTPGLINAATSLGLTEAGGPQFSGGYNDTQASGTKGISAAFNAWEGINPASTYIVPTRQDGITSVLVGPSGGLISGRAAFVDLAGTTVGAMTVRAPVAMYATFDASAGNFQSRGELIGALRDILSDAKVYATKKVAYDANQTRAFTVSRADLEALQPVIAGTMPLAVAVDQASDIRSVLALGKQFGLKLIQIGRAHV